MGEWIKRKLDNRGKGVSSVKMRCVSDAIKINKTRYVFVSPEKKKANESEDSMGERAHMRELVPESLFICPYPTP